MDASILYPTPCENSNPVLPASHFSGETTEEGIRTKRKRRNLGHREEIILIRRFALTYCYHESLDAMS